MSGATEAAVPLNLARELGPRGSREPISSADPAGPATLPVAAVLAALPAWWAHRAQVAGLAGRWLELENALEAEPPWSRPDPPASSDELVLATAEEMGEAYVAALDPSVRARHGRHYTPSGLSAHLWQMMRRPAAGACSREARAAPRACAGSRVWRWLAPPAPAAGAPSCRRSFRSARDLGRPSECDRRCGCGSLGGLGRQCRTGCRGAPATCRPAGSSSASPPGAYQGR